MPKGVKGFVKGDPNAGNPAWKKGVSGNPHGRAKKGHTWADILRKVGEIKDPIEKVKNKIVVAKALYREARVGNVQAAKLIMEMEGEYEARGDLNISFKWQGENGEDTNGPI